MIWYLLSLVVWLGVLVWLAVFLNDHITWSLPRLMALALAVVLVAAVWMGAVLPTLVPLPVCSPNEVVCIDP